jgi:hypothetical protein
MTDIPFYMNKLKKLYAFGCSLTDPNFQSMIHPELDCSYPKWPEIVGNHLSIPVKNYGICNNNNWLIVHDCLRKITRKKDVECVMILWSSPLRHPYGRVSFKPRLQPNQHPILYNIDKYLYKVIDEDKGLLRDFMVNFYQQITFTKSILNKYNIPYVMGLGFRLDGVTDEFKYPHILLNEWLSCIAEENGDFYKEVIGWPFLTELGGYSMTEKLRQLYSPLEFQVSKFDLHPNAFGHEFIAEQFSSRYLDLYK